MTKAHGGEGPAVSAAKAPALIDTKTSKATDIDRFERQT
jgi:hypothetical protein